MRSTQWLLAFVLGSSVVALGTHGCQKWAESKRREGAAEIEMRPGQRTAYVQRQVTIDEQHDYFAMVRREQLELRARLHAEIDAIDKQLAEAEVDPRHPPHRLSSRSRSAAKVLELVERRSMLEEDVSTVERADERGWDELKATVERDVAKGRPHGRMRM